MTRIAVIGGGPAGLMAAEAAQASGAEVDLYDAMPSLGRKFLLAGKGGLNLTHSEPIERFLSRYRPHRASLTSVLTAFDPQTLRRWAKDLGIATFVGSSGRVFPQDLKAGPLLRAWIRRLKRSGVRFHVRHRWAGWESSGALRFQTPVGDSTVQAGAVVLGLGGGSWPQLGSDASWVPLLRERSVEVAPLKPANCGFDVQWSPFLRSKFAGHPVKSVAVTVSTSEDGRYRQQGEFVITETGLEGGVVYAVSAFLREAIEKRGVATLHLDLAPDRELARLVQDLSRSRGKRTIASHLQRYAGITGVKSALLHEVLAKEIFSDPVRLAAAIKSLPVTLLACRPLAEAISTAGGVSFDALDEHLMIRALPGVFCAGEMLDWEAPTGGYLLTACLATGRTAGSGAATWANRRDE